MDLSAGRQSGNFIYLWTKAELPPKSKKKGAKTQQLFKVDCGTYRIKMLEQDIYPARGGVTHEKFDADTDDTVGYLAPEEGSIHYELVHFACFSGPLKFRDPN